MLFIRTFVNGMTRSVTRPAFFFTALSALCVLLAGCGGGGGGGNSSRIVGTWRQVQISQGDTTFNCPSFVFFSDGTEKPCGANDLYTFRSDGTFSATVLGDTGSGTYRYSGGAVRLKFEGLEGAIPVDFKGNNTMIFQYSSEGERYSDIFQRQ